MKLSHLILLGLLALGYCGAVLYVWTRIPEVEASE